MSATEQVSPPTITLVSTYFHPETSGNAPYATEFARALSSAGYAVRVVCGVPHYPAWRTSPEYRRGMRWEENVDGIHVTRLRHWVPRSPGLVGRALLDLTFFISAAWALRRDRAAALVSMTPTISALGACLLMRRQRPVGVIVQDLVGQAAIELGTTSRGTGGLISRIECWMLRRADQVGIIAEAFRRTLVAGRVSPEKIQLVPNFTRVCKSEVDMPEARRRLGWDLDAFLVVHTGNIGQKQGLEVAIDAALLAADKGDNLQLVLLGDGNQRSALEVRSRSSGNVSFVDPLPEGLYPLALGAADALLLTERPGVLGMSLPSKLTSYVVAGKPIIASVEPDGATGQLLRRLQIAVLVEPGDPAALEAAMGSVRSGEVEIDAMAKRADEAAASEFDPNDGRKRYITFCEGLMRMRGVVSNDVRTDDGAHRNSPVVLTEIPHL